MIKYLTEFLTEQEYNDFKNSNDCQYVNVSYISSIDELRYSKDTTDTYQLQPFTLTFTRVDNGAANLQCGFTENPKYPSVSTYLKVKKNNGDWQTFNYTLNIGMIDTHIGIEQGDVIQIINKNNGFWLNVNQEDWNNHHVEFNVSGNIMSTIYGDEYIYAPANKLPLPYNDLYCSTDSEVYDHIKFKLLFFHWYNGPLNVVNAGNLWLPTRNLGKDIFSCLFQNCTSLVTAPAIKAKYLPYCACTSMFENCTSLTQMPNILSEYVEARAMDNMFKGCTNLTTTSTLHIKKIIPYEDTWMSFIDLFKYTFSGCTSLTTAPTWNEIVYNTIPTRGADNWETQHGFENCTSLTDASNLHFNFTPWLWEQYIGEQMSGMFEKCTSLTIGPHFNMHDYDMQYNETTGEYDIYPTLQINADIFKDCGSVNTLYVDYPGKVQSGDGTGSLNGVAASGTVYVPANSEYLPGGSLENEKPFGLTDWTVTASA